MTRSTPPRENRDRHEPSTEDAARRRGYSARYIEPRRASVTPSSEREARGAIALPSPERVAAAAARPAPAAAERAFAAFDLELEAILARRAVQETGPAGEAAEAQAQARVDPAFERELDDAIDHALARKAADANAPAPAPEPEPEPDAPTETPPDAAPKAAPKAAPETARDEPRRAPEAAIRAVRLDDDRADARQDQRPDERQNQRPDERQNERPDERQDERPDERQDEREADDAWIRLETAHRARPAPRRSAAARWAETEAERDLLDEDAADDRFDLSLDDAVRAGDQLDEEIAEAARYRRIAISLASAGVAAILMIAVLGGTGGDPTPPGGGATLASADGVRLPRDAGPAPAPDAIETATISGYVGRVEMATLLDTAPIKCVLPVPENGVAGPDMLGPILESGRAVCAETVDYASRGVLFTHRSRIEGDAVLEINAPFSLQGAALCHHVDNLSALVRGDDVPLARKASIERLVKANYNATPGGRICYRFKKAFSKNGVTAYRADVFIGGAPAPDRADPRPFLMRPRD